MGEVGIWGYSLGKGEFSRENSLLPNDHCMKQDFGEEQRPQLALRMALGQ